MVSLQMEVKDSYDWVATANVIDTGDAGVKKWSEEVEVAWHGEGLRGSDLCHKQGPVHWESPIQQPPTLVMTTGPAAHEEVDVKMMERMTGLAPDLV